MECMHIYIQTHLFMFAMKYKNNFIDPLSYGWAGMRRKRLWCQVVVSQNSLESHDTDCCGCVIGSYTFLGLDMY